MNLEANLFMKDLLEKYKIKANKRTLLLIAGALWTFAGGRVFTLGFGDLTANVGNPIIYLIVSSLVFFMFFKFVFSKMVKKHSKRILNSILESHCLFSFFDVKSYFIMIFMIVGGISVRNAHIFDPRYLGTFYVGLGLALLGAGVAFLYNGVNLKSAKMKYVEIKE